MWELVIPSFVAGVLTFLAPCTLPLVPGFVSYLGGSGGGRRGKLINTLWYVLGFTLVFVLLGMVFGTVGGYVNQYRQVLTKVGGVIIILFGLTMMGVRLPVMEREWAAFAGLRRANASAFLLGIIFALGWSPCVGPILGTVLLLAANTATAATGAGLLFVYSLGLALPFMVMAAVVGHGVKIAGHWLAVLEKVGGVLLVAMGVMILTGSSVVWAAGVYKNLNILRYENLLNYL